MLKKIQFVFIAVLLIVLLLQLLEISNVDCSSDNKIARIKLILSLNYVAIGTILMYLFYTVKDVFSLGKRKLAQSSINEELIENIDVSPVTTDTESAIKHINLENSLIPLLSRCNSAEEVCSKFLSATCSEFKMAQGILFVRKKASDEFYIKGTFAYYNENTGYSFRMGEGICGQVAKNQKAIVITNIPDNYVNIVSGLGLGSPKYLQAIPIIFAGEVIGVLELASFTSDLLQTNDLETGVLKQLSNSLKGFL